MPPVNWTVLKIPPGEIERLERLAGELGLSVELYAPVMHVRRRVSRRRRSAVFKVEAYPGYAFGRGDLDALRHHPQSRFSFLSFRGQREVVSQEQIDLMASLEARWREEAHQHRDRVHVPRFAKGEAVKIESCFMAKDEFYVIEQRKTSVFVGLSGSPFRIEVSPFLLSRIQE